MYIIVVFLLFNNNNNNNNYDLARLVHDQCNLHAMLTRYTLVYPRRLLFINIYIV